MEAKRDDVTHENLMNTKPINLFTNQVRSEWIRLRTLIFLRWMAVVGQIIALLIAHYLVKLDLPFGLCFGVIGISAIFNLVAGFTLPVNKRLSQRAATLSLFFDLLQLIILLFLTGGLSNPFSLLLLAPVTISATALKLNATLFLGGFAILMTTVLVYFNVPLVGQNGQTLELPILFIWGNWFALLIGFVFLSAYARRVTMETFSMSQALAATQMALDREHKLTVLGGVVAAAAHEMGTPLATIKMVATELEEELQNNQELRDDAQLIREQAVRLSTILRDMGRSGKEDVHLKVAPVTEVIREAAEPHQDRGKKITFLINGSPTENMPRSMPSMVRQPEVLHGLRNLIQNAVDFARTEVWIDIAWTDQTIRILVADNGKGYPHDFIGRIGDPFLRRQKRKKDPARPEYEGMGLGLFIAKTMLERTNASLIFANGTATAAPSPALEYATGAMVSVIWKRDEISKVTESGPKNLHVQL
jgi:two-component system sensor histidine kinase RegB